MKAKKTIAKPKAKTVLRSGNPRIAKGDGDAPVQAYIAAMPAGSGTSAGSWTR